jgi:hypothetical protein
VDDSGVLQVLRQRHEAREWVLAVGDEVEAEEVGQVELAEAADEGRVRGEPEPVPADGSGADKAGGETEAEMDLVEEVAVAEYLSHGSRGC